MGGVKGCDIMSVNQFVGLSATILLLAGCQSSPTTRAPITDNSAPVEVSQPGAPAATETSFPVRRPAPSPREPGPESVVTDLTREAQSLLQQERWQESIRLAEQGLRIDRREAAFYRILGESYLALGDLVQARRFANQAQRFCGGQCREVSLLQQRLLRHQ